MKKIALVSAVNHNYGSVLQAFSLQYVLYKIGVNTEIIDYHKTQSIKQLLRVFNISLTKAKIKTIYKEIMISRKNNLKKYANIKENRFKDFLLKYCLFSESIQGMSNLKRKIREYDSVILGSDQVWNPMNIGTDFFNLLFVPNDMKKYTYASSFGVSRIPKNQRRKTKKYLSRIDKIAVREKTGAKIIKELLNQDVEITLDPTLLLDKEEWERCIPKYKVYEKKYIFAYFVGASIKNRQVAEKVSKSLGIALCVLPHIDEYVHADIKYENEISVSAGPIEFVNFIRGAEFILTDSLHATIFSILNEKKFCVLDRFKTNSHSNMNSRIENLLRNLELEERKIETYEDWVNVNEKSIDYYNVKKILEKQRKKSFQYLEQIKEDIGA